MILFRFCFLVYFFFCWFLFSFVLLFYFCFLVVNMLGNKHQAFIWLVTFDLVRLSSPNCLLSPTCRRYLIFTCLKLTRGLGFVYYSGKYGIFIKGETSCDTSFNWIVPRTLLLQVKMQVNVSTFYFELHSCLFPLFIKIMITCIYMYIFSVGVWVILVSIPC